MTAKLVITKRKQHFLVNNFDSNTYRIITNFARNFIHWGITKKNGRFVKAALKVFAASRHDRDEFRFHINQLDDFLKFLKEQGITEDKYVLLLDMPAPGADVTFRVKDSWVPRKEQEPVIDYILDESGAPQRLIGLQTGFGKAQPIDAKILTPKGWKTLGEVVTGDSILTHDGQLDTIVGTYPQGEVPTAKLVFDDGRRTNACLDHLWRVYNNQDHSLWRLLRTQDILDIGIGSGDYTLFELYKPCMELAPAALPEDPYTVGRLYDDIPAIYFTGNYEQRLAVVQGSLDASNVRYTPEGLEVDVATQEHARALQELVRGLGGWCAVYDLDGRTVILVRHPDPVVLFRDRVHPINYEFRSDRFLELSAILDNGITECVCVKVRNEEELYVTDDYIVTHNTFVSIYSVSKLGKRTVYLMRAMYMDKWFLDFDKTYEDGTNDALLIRGADQLKALMHLALEGGLEAGNIVISNTTYQSYIKQYEKHGDRLLDLGWPLLPDQFWGALGVGICVIDEVHLDFHLNFKFSLYMNVPLLIAMSATLISDDQFILRMQELYFPSKERYNGGDYNRYINASSYAYQFSRPDKIRTSEYGDTRYSHHVFERSVMAHKPTKENYYRMIENILKTDYLDIRAEGQTALIFCASIKMCTDLVAWLSARHPNLKIRRYVQGDDYNADFLDSDVCVSTVGKSGAAVDKPGLRTNIRTISIRSTASNYQVFGRTRGLQSGDTPRFIYLVSTDIPKQVEYHEHMVRILRDTALSYRHRQHDEII